MQEKIHVTDTERVKKPTQNQNASKSAKTHHSVKIANALPWCTLAFNMATMPP